MQLFPVFLDLARRPCLVVGGGAVGRHKAAALAATGAAVLVVDPSPTAALLSLAEAEPLVEVQARAFGAGDLVGRVLVFACTGDADVNAHVAGAAAALGILCSRADGGGDFSTGALLRRGDLCVAVSSGGSSPALAVHARDRIAANLGEEFGAAARLLRALRERLRSRAAHAPERAAALASVDVRGLLEALSAGDDDAARALVEGAFEAAFRAADEGRRAGEGSRCTR